jgi:hypothetical protein
MFRLIKLAVYLIAGYALYEFVQGLTEQRASGGKGQSSGRSQLQPQSRATSQTGSNRVPVQDSSGVDRMQSVGRGVVS